jgi:hypothetical protein
LNIAIAQSKPPTFPMTIDKAAEVTRRLKQVAEEEFLRIMEETDRVDPDRTQSTTTAYRRVALSSALDAAIAALNPIDRHQSSSGKLRDSAPTSYRLLRKLSGELVLQGGFLWHEEGTEKAGFEWRETHTEVEHDPNTNLIHIAPDNLDAGEGI